MKTEDKNKVKLYSNDYYYSKLLERLVIPKWQWEISVKEAVGGGGGGSVNSVNGKTGTVVLTGEDIELSSSEDTSLTSIITTNEDNINTINTITIPNLQTQIDSIDLSNYYTNTQIDTFLLAKADVTTVDALDTRVSGTEDDIVNINSSLSTLDTEVDDIVTALDTKADIAVQQPSCLALLSTGTALALPTTYTTITFLENPLLVGTMMTSDLTTVTFTKAGFVDLQITGEVTGAIEVQVLLNGVVANLSHFVKITATDTYETLSVDIRRIEVAVDDTIEIQMQSTDGAFNNIILFMRESF